MMWGNVPGGGMAGWGYGVTGVFNMAIWIILVVIVVAAVAWFVRRSSLTMHRSDRRRSPGLDAIEERYARGEVDRDEYLQKKRDMST